MRQSQNAPKPGNLASDLFEEALPLAIKLGIGHESEGRRKSKFLKRFDKHLRDRCKSDPKFKADILKERFPLLPHFVWSTQQVNPWMHHLLGRFVNFIYVDAEGADDVCEFLEGDAWAVTLNPTRKTRQNFHARKKNAVVRGLRREIDVENEPTPEGILVDLYMENGRLGLMDKAEYQEMALNLCSHCRIDMARLLHLLGHRKKTPEEVLSKESADYLGIS